MRVIDIKEKASEILSSSWNELTKEFLVIAVIGSIASGIGNLLGGTIGSIIGLVITLVFLPFEHGYIVGSLKAVNNRPDELNVEQDAFVGFTRFKELFSTYFVYNFFLMIVLFLAILIAIAAFIMVVPSDLLSSGVLYQQFSGGVYNQNAVLNAEMYQLIEVMGAVGGFILLFVMVILLIVAIYSLYFALTPYILERYQIRGVKALKESARLMNGYKWFLFKLNLSFIGWMLIGGIITSILNMVLPVSILVNAISAAIGIYLYQTKLQVCKAVLFEEILIADNQAKATFNGSDATNG